VRRLVALAGILGTLSTALAGTSASLVATVAAGGGACEGGDAVSTPGPTQATAAHSSALGAAANFTSVSGTTETDIFISAFRESASGATSASVVFVQIMVFDTTTGTPSLDALGCTESPNFQIDQALTSATLGPTSVTLVDSDSNTSTTATVSVDWTGVGDVTRQTNVSHFHSAAFTMIFNLTSFDRFADATGSVDDLGLNLSFDGAAVQADLDKVNDGLNFVCVGGSC
jgi:hypothetical protein